jgi:hypothetical protein
MAEGTVDRLLAAVAAGAGAGTAGLFADDAVLDATVPGWRFTLRGAAAVAAQYGRWFAHPGELEDVRRHAIAGGEVVELTLAWEEGGVPHAAHQVHVLLVDAATGRIAEDRMWCGGRWDAALLAEMGAAHHAG